MRMLGVLPIVLTLCLFQTGVTVSQDNETRSLVRLQQEWMAAFQRHDWAVLKDLLAEDFTCTSDRGTLGKRDSISLAEKLDLGERRIELSDSRVRVYGSAAVSTGG